MSLSKKSIDEAKKLINDFQTTLKESNVDEKLKTYEEKFNSVNSDTKETLSKITALLDKSDKEIQTETNKENAFENRIRDFETQLKNMEEMISKESDKEKSSEILERIKTVEGSLAKIGKKTNSGSRLVKFDTPEYHVLQKMVKQGDDSLTDLDRKTLRTDNGPKGGYLVPEVLYDNILEQVQEIDPIRPLSRVFTATVKTLNVPILKELPTATYEGETEEISSDEATYRLEQMTAYAQQIVTPITWDLIEFNAYDIIAQASRDAAMAFAIGEGKGFLSGSGVKSPEGILTNTDVLAGAVETAANDAVSLVDVVKLPGNLKTGYLANARFFMNQKTLYDLRAEQDSNGNFLWRIGGENMPNNIAGHQYVILPNMPDVADGDYPVGIGDFFYGYYILDAVGISLIRDDFSQKKKRVVELSWHRYNTGQVGIAEAFQLLQVK